MKPRATPKRESRPRGKYSDHRLSRELDGTNRRTAHDKRKGEGGRTVETRTRQVRTRQRGKDHAHPHTTSLTKYMGTPSDETESKHESLINLILLSTPLTRPLSLLASAMTDRALACSFQTIISPQNNIYWRLREASPSPVPPTMVKATL